LNKSLNSARAKVEEEEKEKEKRRKNSDRLTVNLIKIH